MDYSGYLRGFQVFPAPLDAVAQRSYLNVEHGDAGIEAAGDDQVNRKSGNRNRYAIRLDMKAPGLAIHG